ncbi:MAG: RDD family protein [Chitinophagaceae bacterium]
MLYFYSPKSNNYMNPGSDYLQDTEHQYEDASSTQRLVNYIVDNLTFSIFLSVIYHILVMADMQILFRDDMRVILYLVNIILYVTYICLSEKLGNGRSLGKLVTQTIAIQEKGIPLRWSDALRRSICRVIPFEPFSALGSSLWHDKWTHTRVVKLK